MGRKQSEKRRTVRLTLAFMAAALLTLSGCAGNSGGTVYLSAVSRLKLEISGDGMVRQVEALNKAGSALLGDSAFDNRTSTETLDALIPLMQTEDADTVFVDGAATEVRTIAVETLREPVTEHLVTGTQLKDSMYGEIGGQEFVWPVPQYRQISRWMGGGHTGTDIAAPEGTPIIASAAGTVVTAYYWNGIRTQGDYNSYGNYVEIDHENGYRTLYGHMIRFVVTQGEHVEQGQLIGYVGNTGYSLGAHCHFEMFGPNGRFSARQVFPTMARLNY